MPGAKKQQSIRVDESLVAEFRNLSPGHVGLSMSAIFDFALRVTIDALNAKQPERLVHDLPQNARSLHGAVDEFDADDDPLTEIGI